MFLFDPTAFWLEQMKNIDPIHSSLASTALKLVTCPLTEVTSERIFSLLGFVVNKLRTSLRDDLVEDLLFCKWNDPLETK
jgi:hypothetical protein